MRIEGLSPRDYAFQWASGGCLIQQWASGAIGITDALIQYVDQLRADADTATDRDGLAELLAYLREHARRAGIPLRPRVTAFKQTGFAGSSRPRSAGRPWSHLSPRPPAGRPEKGRYLVTADSTRTAANQEWPTLAAAAQQSGIPASTIGARAERNRPLSGGRSERGRSRAGNHTVGVRRRALR